MTRQVQVVVPMAGLGSRFAAAGYHLPKPLIDVGGAPMISRVIDNLRLTQAHRFVFVVQRAHVEGHGLAEVLQAAAPGCSVVEIDGVTEGAACTVLTARGALDPDGPLMIANCDQWVDTSVDDYVEAFERSGAGGFIMVMPESDPKWSYAAVGPDGWVCRVAEKEPISPFATVGIYNFATARAFVDAATGMIAGGRKVNGEYYVAPVYNELIADGARIGIRNIENGGRAMYGLGTPDDLRAFLQHPPAGWQRRYRSEPVVSAGA